MRTSSNKIILILLVILVGETVLLSYFYSRYQYQSSIIADYQNTKIEKLDFIENVERNYAISEREELDQVTAQNESTDELAFTGWIPDWDFKDGFDSFKDNSDMFTSISPFWYSLNSDGSLKDTPNTNNPDLISYTQSHNIDLIPTITNFDADLFSEVMSSEQRINNHVNSIVEVVTDNNYAGIDLDYEQIYLKDKANFYKFLQSLSLKMNKKDKKLVFTVLPKWGDETVYLGFPETRKVQDYKRIADLVDEFRIMTYEYTGRDNEYYGPVAPLNWMEDIVRYAILVGVPRDKIMLGIHTYSYDYPDREVIPSIDYYPVLKNKTTDEKESAAAYYNETVETVKSKFNYNEEYIDSWGEVVLKYKNDGTNRVIVYPNNDSISDRKDLATKYGLKGVAIWRLGDESGLSY